MLKIHILQNRKTKQYYWRAVSRNGKVIADGSETYTSIAMANKGLTAFTSAVGVGKFKVVLPEVKVVAKPAKSVKVTKLIKVVAPKVAKSPKVMKTAAPKPIVKVKKAKKAVVAANPPAVAAEAVPPTLN